MKNQRPILLGVFLSVLAGGLMPASLAAAPPERQEPVRFERDVLPVLAEKCFECHGPDEEARQAGLRLDTRDGPYTRLESGGRAVVANDPAASLLLSRIASHDPDSRMPPPDSGERLDDAQIALIRRWIGEGAAWTSHWAFEPPQQVAPPQVEQRDWARNPIDQFVLAQLESQGRRPSAEADRRALIRRVTLDLIGLPPTPQQIEQFLQDPAPDAYERLVDRLLQSPHYGERMALAWLDAARYADTHGYLFDTERSMWRWRDWVIGAYNDNMPFDQFTIEQLAGDLLPKPTLSQRIATGFNRNHIINNEAGATAQEYFVENVVDRVNTTATVWMGLSLQCCQCHDHKYDPFTQKDYYRLYALFNNVPEVGLDGLNDNANPRIKAPTAAEVQEQASLKKSIASQEEAMKSAGPEIERHQREWEQTVASEPVTMPHQLLASWRFDNSPQDAAEPECNARFEAAEAEYKEGVFAAAASFDGLRYLDAGDRFDFSKKDHFTISAWVRPSVKPGRMTIVSRMRDDKQLFRGYALQVINGLPAFFLIHTFPDNMIQVQGKVPLKPKRWQHLAVTYDGSGKAAGVKLYLDGKLQEPGVKVDSLKGSVTTDEAFWIANGHPTAKFKGLVDDLRIYDDALTAEMVARLPGLSVESLIVDGSRTVEQKRRLKKHYLQHAAPEQWRQTHAELQDLKSKLEQREQAVPTVMVMQEMPKRRETRLLIRGVYNKPGEVVLAGTPTALPPLGESQTADRLGLAQWLVDPQHPLTARVAVNRYWQMHFGQGLVSTAEDFGVRGQRPSHPDLLDWLAVEFVERGWNVKAIQRLIVTSATYRQSSRVTLGQVQSDPHNRWLSRGLRHRLPAELIRDQALAVSGLLVDTIGGPSVKPYQPAGLWREVAFDFSGGNLTAQIYKQDNGARLYRRSLYTFWKRTAPPPDMLLFDAPDRERCVVRRVRTNTPLQALVLLNSTIYVEAARKLAERMMLEAGTEAADRVDFAFELLMARRPTPTERDLVLTLLGEQQSRFRDDAKTAKLLLEIGDSKWNESLDPAELSAYTIIANMLLNLDETITLE